MDDCGIRSTLPWTCRETSFGMREYLDSGGAKWLIHNVHGGRVASWLHKDAAEFIVESVNATAPPPAEKEKE